MLRSKYAAATVLGLASVFGLAAAGSPQVNRPAPAPQLKLNQPSETELLARRISALEADAAQLKADNAQLKADNEQLKKEMAATKFMFVNIDKTLALFKSDLAGHTHRIQAPAADLSQIQNDAAKRPMLLYQVQANYASAGGIFTTPPVK